MVEDAHNFYNICSNLKRFETDFHNVKTVGLSCHAELKAYLRGLDLT